MPSDFTTVAAVKTYMTLGRQTGLDVGLIQLLIAGVSQTFRSELDREILTSTFDEIRDGTGTNVMMFTHYPVTAVSAVEVGIPGGRSPLTENVDYVWTSTAVKLLSGKFPKGVASVRLAYSAGYASYPADLVDAATKATAYKYRQLERLGQTSKTLAGETVNFDLDEFPKDVVGTLENYKRRIQLSDVR